MKPLLLFLALATGAAATFNPCGVGLLPSYVGLLVGRPSSGRWRRGLAEGLAVGASMTAGLLLLYVPIALAFGSVAGFVGPRVPLLGAGVGLLLVAWGVAILLRPDRFLLSVPLHGGRGGGRFGALAYGFAFGLASLGCTFPLFVSLVFQASAAGSAAAGAVVVLAYAAGMGATVTVLAVLARLARSGLERFLRRSAAAAGRLAGVVVLLSGLFVVVYWLR